MKENNGHHYLGNSSREGVEEEGGERSSVPLQQHPVVIDAITATAEGGEGVDKFPPLPSCFASHHHHRSGASINNYNDDDDDEGAPPPPLPTFFSARTGHSSRYSSSYHLHHRQSAIYDDDFHVAPGADLPISSEVEKTEITGR